MRHHLEIVPRDDGMFDVVSGDIIAGLPTISFAMQVAGGHPPAPASIAKFRRIQIREVRNASA